MFSFSLGTFFHSSTWLQIHSCTAYRTECMDAEQRNRAIRIRRFGYLDSMICHCVDKYDSLDYPILIADIDFGSSTTRRANTLSLSLSKLLLRMLRLVRVYRLSASIWNKAQTNEGNKVFLILIWSDEQSKVNSRGKNVIIIIHQNNWNRLATQFE